MDIIGSLVKFVINLLNTLLPTLGVPDSFFVASDGALSGFIAILQTASWFVPLDLLILCFSVMLIADNFALIARIAQFIVKLIRG